MRRSGGAGIPARVCVAMTRSGRYDRARGCSRAGVNSIDAPPSVRLTWRVGHGDNRTNAHPTGTRYGTVQEGVMTRKLYPAMVTPLADGGDSLDEAAFRPLIDLPLGHGADGLS